EAAAVDVAAHYLLRRVRRMPPPAKVGMPGTGAHLTLHRKSARSGRAKRGPDLPRCGPDARGRAYGYRVRPPGESRTRCCPCCLAGLHAFAPTTTRGAHDTRETGSQQQHAGRLRGDRAAVADVLTETVCLRVALTRV